ncbi:D-serine deaminase-like pyridoxal phosphate-dependent protein [Leucobacter luti]|uniref:alanine racemase n=1 Tax=Leucobacter luti TaxID=340320 RepID=UPI00104C62C9|nr:alanine racemase [Leucobacter luti]MCW2287235.1 D-serine deaminase-like pyridoxal phosphate-dependent protein [Leucobacter luti]TCK41460.1 D-serine deaminase-like pyridoxal phosphate-dependent protein [Leucobacter luti]
MTLDLTGPDVVAAAALAPWLDAERYWSMLDAATQDRAAPVLALSVAALRRNADDLARRAGGLPIRVASKSVRSRAVLDAVLALPGYRGVLAYTVAEANWLAETLPDVVVAYPSVDRAAIRELATGAPELAARVTLMVDSVEQLDLIDAVAAPAERAPIRICIDLDASWRSRVLGHIGVRRSPLHSPTELSEFARLVVGRPGFTLVGIMAYEAQIAGVGDRPGSRAQAALLRRVQQSSGAELAERRALAVAAVREIADLEFVNGGGTGSVVQTAAEAAVTEVAAGSGLYGPHLFDHYSAFDVAPALGFALDVVRKPTADRATLLGGGWIASGPAAADRLPLPVWPVGLSYEPREGAGEVQTPVRGDAATALRPGDRVWFRHTKAGEPLEHASEVVPVGADGVAADPVLSYRGEGKCFL